MAPGSLPLVAVRADIDAGWPSGARWTGSDGTILEQPLGSRVSFLLRTEEPLRLRGRARLSQESAGTARLSLFAVEGGRERRLWRRGIRRWRGRRFPAELRLDLTFAPEGETRIVLLAEGPSDAFVRWESLEVSTVGDAGSSRPTTPRTPDGGPPEARPQVQRAEGPLFSVLTPVHDPPPELLAETIESVLAQSTENWELCLVDDGSADARVREMLGEYVATDERIRMLRHERAEGISGATNTALEMARGEYIAFLDHDDTLLSGALATVESALLSHPGTDMLYSDEEVVEEGGRTRATYVKPHWSPDLLRSQMYVCHLGVYRRSLALEAGGFRPEFDGSQDLDFSLRVAERTDRVVHIPHILYRWRAHAGSASGNAHAKPHAYPAARRAIAEHLQRTGVDAEVHFGDWQGIYRVVHSLPPEAKVALAVLAEGNPEPAAARLLEAAAEESRTGVSHPRPVCAATAPRALEACESDDVIVLCEYPVEPLTRLWLARLAAFALQPGVAAVGAKVIAPDGRVEQAGLAVQEGVPMPLRFAVPAEDPGPMGVGLVPANVSATAGVVALAGGPLRDLGGLRSEAGPLAVADYCLRATEAGLRVVMAPDVILRRTCRSQPASDIAAMEGFRDRWAGEFGVDRYLSGTSL